MKNIKQKGRLGDCSVARLYARAAAKGNIVGTGRFHVKCFRKGKLIWEDVSYNLVVNEGLNHLLDATLSAGTQITSWYVGLTTGSPTPAAGDTLVSHAGWTEAAGYSGTRKAWTDGGVSSQSVDNSASPASFTMTGSATIGGCFLCSVTSGTAGTLFSAVAFTGGNRSVVTDDVLNVTYTFTAADDGV